MEGIYMAFLLRCSLDHRSVSQEVDVDDYNALPPLIHDRNLTPTGNAVEEGVDEDMAVIDQRSLMFLPSRSKVSSSEFCLSVSVGPL